MYVRQIDGKTLTLQVSGKLWMRSLVMRDLETGSEWSHLLGEAMAGPLKGRTLKPVITDMVTWKVWKQEHPDTTVLNMTRTHDAYSAAFYRRPEQFVFGFNVGAKHFHVPLSVLQKHHVLNFNAAGKPLLVTYVDEGKVVHLFEPTIDNRTLTFQPVDEFTMRDRETRSTWSLLNGKCTDGPLKGRLLKQRVGIMSFQNAWQNFHPESKAIHP